MNKTTFAGITRLDPGESLAQDNYAFQNTDREVIDKLLRVGAQSHHHDAHQALAHAYPELAPAASVSPTGGTIASDLTITVGYTLVDADGGETTLNPTPALVSTPPGLTVPDTAPGPVPTYASGTLLAGTYAYAATVTDGVGGETMLGPFAEAVLDPGYASGRVTIYGLSAIAALGGGPGWRLWRTVNGGPLALIATGTSTTVVDDGSLCPDTSVTPPNRTGATRATSKLTVTVPAGQPPGAVSYALYATLDGSFQSPALLGAYPIASAGTVQEYTALALGRGSPPVVSRALPGANRINPDTDMIEFPWKRPAADAATLPGFDNAIGDVRLVYGDMRLYGWGTDDTWTPLVPPPPVLPTPEDRTAVAPSGAVDGFASGWQNEGSVGPPVSYWLDENGDLQLEGAAMKVTTPVDGDVIFTLPPTHAPPPAPYLVIGGDSVTPRASAAVDITAGGDVVWRTGSTDIGAWVALNVWARR
jgi:hypothetical protein